MKTIRVDDSFNQKTIQLSVGDSIELQLEETPTTGYKWEIVQINTGQLEAIENTYSLDKEAGIGGGGVRTFRLHVLDKGNGQIVLENRQRWNNDVYKTFKLFYKPE